MLPRHAELWVPGYLKDRRDRRHQLARPPKRLWFSFVDHFEPKWNGANRATALKRVNRFLERWPRIAEACVRDSCGNPPKYTFFYAEEEYLPELVSPLEELVRNQIADVEVHIHHKGEGRQDFVSRISRFCSVLHNEHGLLRVEEGKIRFGFIHGNWALDNSLGGAFCGLNDEISLLRDLGCYADFTMPAGDSRSQARMVNIIYWCKDDPNAPKSYDSGLPVDHPEATGDLLIIPGPLGLRWRGRFLPRLETGEIASYDPPTPYRAQRWLSLAPRVGDDVFLKLYTHGTQERNSAVLLGSALEECYRFVAEEAHRLGMKWHYVSTWEMFRQIQRLCRFTFDSAAHASSQR